MDAVEEEVPHVVISGMLFVCPQERDRLALAGSRESGEWGNNVRVARDETCGLHEYAESAPQFW